MFVRFETVRRQEEVGDLPVYLTAQCPASVQHQYRVKVAHGVIMCVPLDLKNEDSQNAETMTPHRPFIIPLDL